jgi:hypothetical protein
LYSKPDTSPQIVAALASEINGITL